MPETRQVKKQIRHGIECPKVPHTGAGYLHGENNDRPYDVDGVMYCGRCHEWLYSDQRDPEEDPS